MKSRDGQSQRREEKKKEDQKRESFRRKNFPGARKGRKVAKHCVFPMICGSGGSKSRLAKAAGAEPAGQMRDEKLHVQVKMYKAPQLRRSCDVQKVHAVVVRSTFPSQNVQNTPAPDHFWKLRCRKKCTPLWREAHFEVKTLKAPEARTTFGRSDVVSRGRRKGLCTLSEVIL